MTLCSPRAFSIYIFSVAGQSEIPLKLDSLHEKIVNVQLKESERKLQLEQYKKMFKYIAFVASASKIYIGQKLFEKTRDILDKTGTVDNILIWSSWTPQQLQILSSPEVLKKVALCGGHGSGKTLVLKEMAKRRNREGKTVVFIVFADSEAKSLLYLQLKAEFNETSIELMCLRPGDFSKKLDLKDKDVFMDEIIDRKLFRQFSECNDLSDCSSIWIVTGASPDELKNEHDGYTRCKL